MTEQNSTVLVTPWRCTSQIKSESFISLSVGPEASAGREPQSGGCNTPLVCSALLNPAVLQERARIVKLSLAFIPSRAYSSLGIQLCLQYVLCHIL